MKIALQRSAFRWLTLVYQNLEAVATGFNILVVAKAFGTDSVTRENTDILMAAHSCRYYSMHIFLASPDGQSASIMLRFFAAFASLTMVFLDRMVYTRVHLNTDRTPMERLHKIRLLGYLPSSIPPTLGGAFSTERFDEWLSERRLLDRLRHQNLTKCSFAPGSCASTFLERLISESSITKTSCQQQIEQQLLAHETVVSEQTKARENLGATTIYPPQVSVSSDDTEGITKLTSVSCQSQQGCTKKDLARLPVQF